MTEREFWAALGVRDFHTKRVERFNDGQQLPHEDSASLHRSITLLTSIRDFLGDGVMPDLAWNTQLTLNTAEGATTMTYLFSNLHNKEGDTLSEGISTKAKDNDYTIEDWLDDCAEIAEAED